MIMFMTLDGVAEFPVYDQPPSSGEPDDPMWDPRMEGIDTILLGANAYRAWADHWPKRRTAKDSIPWERRFSEFADEARKVVFSKTIEDPAWKNTTVARGGVVEEVRRLKDEPGKDMALGGGPRLAQSFLEHGLVDEMLLEVFPSLVGGGKPFFDVRRDPDSARNEVPLGAAGRHDFALVEARRVAGEDTVFLHYERR